ncbi:hypothetical protein [Microvirga sp. Mcv34]|uniref:hypothetical protein n=1 Tax=Microvirga sp. Mcv34 TaxID=2926016 RepID=UPI0021CAC21C|nr:hypothetical protein [Microvirga sp. Mcv34]
MTEEEIDAVAEELAKAGGISWYPGQTSGPLLRPVGERYRNRARAAISALDRLRARPRDISPPSTSSDQAETFDVRQVGGTDALVVGAIVMYRPPGDKRAVPCRVEGIEDGRAYLIPCPKPDFGWISLEDLSPSQ